MVGKEVLLGPGREQGETETGWRSGCKPDRGLPAVRGVSLTVRRGRSWALRALRATDRASSSRPSPACVPCGVARCWASPAGKPPGDSALGLAMCPRTGCHRRIPPRTWDNLIVGRKRKRFSWGHPHEAGPYAPTPGGFPGSTSGARGWTRRVPSRGQHAKGGGGPGVLLRHAGASWSQPTRGVDIGPWTSSTAIMEKRNAAAPSCW